MSTQQQGSQQSGSGRKPGRKAGPKVPTASLPRLSEFSSGSLPHTLWSSQDVLLGVGIVIIQPTTNKIVVVYHKTRKYWFFPRGRKDVGESLEVAALREAYEESGYRATFFPLTIPHRQPSAPTSENGHWLNTESVFLTFRPFHPRRLSNGHMEPHGGQYLTFWYVAQIPDDAASTRIIVSDVFYTDALRQVHEEGTGMADEQDFETHLFTFEEAVQRVTGEELNVLKYVWAIYLQTLQFLGATAPAPQAMSSGSS